MPAVFRQLTRARRRSTRGSKNPGPPQAANIETGISGKSPPLTKMGNDGHQITGHHILEVNQAISFKHKCGLADTKNRQRVGIR